MSAPLVVNTRDGVCWTRRTVTPGGIALYAPESVQTCPNFVMATLAELAEHGIAGSADVLPVPVGTAPLATQGRARTMLDHARDALNARMTKDDLRLVLENVVTYAAVLESRLAEDEVSPLAWAEQLDETSLGNFLHTLGMATDVRPLAGALAQVREVIRSFREALPADAERPVSEGETYWRVAEPDVQVKVTRVWQKDDADEPSVAFDIRGRDWRDRPCTSFSALRLSLFRKLYRLDTTVPQPEQTQGGGA